MKRITLILLIFLTTACSTPIGTITLHSVNTENKLESPLVRSSELLNNQKTIFKSEADGRTDGDDVFSIYLTDTYLRYLKDFGSSNEVLIVVEFTEAVTGTPGDTITKILGPYNNIADATRAPLLNKAIYGPKKMESDLLTMNIKIYEYDLEENDDSAAMLEFIATSAASLALADPITLGEIKIAKEISQTLIRTNENDLVLNMDLDFVAGNEKYKPYTTSRVLPLKDGELVIVKQEACRIGSCYDYFSKFDSDGGAILPGLITDAIMFLPTTVMRATIDVPDGNALSKFKESEVKVNSNGLSKVEDDAAYVDKTWVRLSIVKGGDATQWEVRKSLYPQEEELNKLLRNPYSLTLENVERFNNRLKVAQKTLFDSKANVKLTSIYSQENIHYIDATKSKSTLCIKNKSSITIVEKYSSTMGLTDVTSPVLSRSKDSVCFNLLPKASFTEETGQFQVVFVNNGKTNSVYFPIIVVTPIKSGDFSASCTLSNNNDYVIKLIASSEKTRLVKFTSINNKNIDLTVVGELISLKSSVKNPTIDITGLFGGVETLTVNTCP